MTLRWRMALRITLTVLWLYFMVGLAYFNDGLQPWVRELIEATG